MKLIAAALVLAAAPAAYADNTCKATGTPIFEVDDMVDKSSTEKVTEKQTQLYASGAWTITTDTTRTGCLDKQRMTEIRDHLQQMPWKISHPRIRCMAISEKFTVYKIDGQTKFTQRVCGPDVLDDKTQGLLAQVIASLNK